VTAPFRVLPLHDLLKSSDCAWALDGLVPDRGLTFVVGRHGSGKTFLLLDMALHIVSGRPWQGRAVRDGWVYFGYGEGLMKNRVAAWCAAHDLQTAEDMDNAGLEGLHFIPGAINLLDDLAVERFLRHIGKSQPSAVILETLSTCTAGADENSPEVVGRVLQALQHIKTEAKTAVIVSHHTPHDPRQQRLRGHSRLGDSADAVLLLENSDGALKLRTLKQREAEAAPDIHLQLTKAHGSLVITSAAPAASKTELGTQERRAMLERMGSERWRVLALSKALGWSKSKTRDRLEEAYTLDEAGREADGPRGAFSYFRAGEAP
jgi:hypothetical protein